MTLADRVTLFVLLVLIVLGATVASTYAIEAFFDVAEWFRRRFR